MRIDLPVGVNYATSPKRAIEVLEATAHAHPEVLREPTAQAIFVGFGDSSINFELRAWTDEFANSSRIRTELASAVYEAINEAGMSFPFPQREVRLLSDSKDALPMASPDNVTARNEGNSRAVRESKRPENEPGRE